MFYFLNTAKNEVIYTQVDPDELETESSPNKQPRSWGYILHGEEKTA